ncbi:MULTISPECIES: molybdopterin molybdotransferase MoeA [unclassified Agarivorans]|uniref:molybdopterin molybdotransferase MoeA n=1 Tax=unclassified Agarivorans TaxID=2636026 RepID=UPI003D7D287A
MDCCHQPGLLPLEQAKALLNENVKVITKTEMVGLDSALNRVLAADLISPLNIPPFDNSAMDGYALCVSHLPANQQLPLSEKVFAGDVNKHQLKPKHCVRIMTGAPLPCGADAVEMQENTSVDGSLITFKQPISIGNNIRKMGEDITQGQIVISANTLLNSSHIGLLASLGFDQIAVQTRLKVALMSTGDELIAPGNPLSHGQIYDSNRFAIKAMLERLPVEVLDFGLIPDQHSLIKQAFEQADQQADIVICSGGVSVGEADYTKLVLDELGEIGFWKVAMKPGKPFAFGQLKESYFIGLPGNPVSAYITFYKLALLVIAKASAWNYQAPPQISAQTTTALKKRPGRLDFQRGIVSTDAQGQLQVSPTGNQGSAIFSSLSQANCFIVLEQERGKVMAGEWVKIELFASPMI